jgi:DnaJ-class molecular chaperone
LRDGKSAPPTTAWAALARAGLPSAARLVRALRRRPRRAGGVDLGDLFDSLGAFGRATGFGRGRGARRGPAMAFPGEDFEVPVRLTLEEAFRGTERTVQLEGRSFTARIPPGATDGQRLRLRGKGGPGTNGSAPGDLYLQIRLEPHPLYRVSGTTSTSRFRSPRGRRRSAPRSKSRR